MLLRKLRTKGRNRKGLALVLAFIVMISMLTMGAVFDIETVVASTKVTLVQKDIFNDTEKTREIITEAETVDAFLTEQGIELSEDDVLSVDLSAKIYSNQVITLEKSRLVGIDTDGKIHFERTMKRTVGEFLEDAGIVLEETDVVTPSEDTVITPEMTITIVDVFEDVVEVEIPYESITEEDSSLYVGETAVKQYGEKGIRREVYKITKSGDEENSRELISSEVVKEPVTEILLSGTKQKQHIIDKKESVVKENAEFKKVKEDVEETKAQQQAAPVVNVHPKGFSYSNVLTVNSTAYDPTLGGKKAGESRTASGLVAERGVVAVDPSVIPLGTRLYIESSDGGASWVYGYCVAGDTGGAIKGLKVDLCFNTYQECIQFGRRTATVYILN